MIHGIESQVAIKSVVICYLFIYLFIKIYLILFIFGCVGSSLLHAGFSLVAASWGATLRCGTWASHCGGFSCW